MWEIYELSSPPPSSSRSGAQPTTPIPYLYTYWGGLWVKPEGVGGKGAELVNLPFPGKHYLPSCSRYVLYLRYLFAENKTPLLFYPPPPLYSYLVHYHLMNHEL